MENDFISKIGDVIILENDERFLVLDCIVFENKRFLSVTAINAKNADSLENFVKAKYVEERYENGDLLFFDIDDVAVVEKLFNLQKRYSKALN